MNGNYGAGMLEGIAHYHPHTLAWMGLPRRGQRYDQTTPVRFRRGPVRSFSGRQRVLGGAPFNVAWHLQAFGQSPHFISRVGDDAAGETIRNAMHEWGMDMRGLQTDPERPTGRVEVSSLTASLLTTSFTPAPMTPSKPMQPAQNVTCFITAASHCGMRVREKHWRNS